MNIAFRTPPRGTFPSDGTTTPSPPPEPQSIPEIESPPTVADAVTPLRSNISTHRMYERRHHYNTSTHPLFQPRPAPPMFQQQAFQTPPRDGKDGNLVFQSPLRTRSAEVARLKRLVTVNGKFSSPNKGSPRSVTSPLSAASPRSVASPDKDGSGVDKRDESPTKASFLRSAATASRSKASPPKAAASPAAGSNDAESPQSVRSIKRLVGVHGQALLKKRSGRGSPTGGIRDVSSPKSSPSRDSYASNKSSPTGSAFLDNDRSSRFRKDNKNNEPTRAIFRDDYITARSQKIAKSRAASRSSRSGSSRTTGSTSRSTSIFQKMRKSRPSSLTTSRFGNPKQKKMPTISELCAAILPIQRMVRQYLSIKRVERRSRNILTVQCVSRQWIARKKYLEIRNKVCKVQSLHRGNEARFVYSRLCQLVFMVKTLQKVYRGNRVREIMACQHEAATVIQSSFRRMMVCENYLSMFVSVVCIQSVMRMFHLKRRYQKRYGSALKASVVVQCLFRKWSAVRFVTKFRIEKREREEYEAARKIEAVWRGFVTRNDYIMTVGELILCQAIVRQHIASRRVKKVRHHKRSTDAATCIQTNYRTRIATHAYLYTVSCIILIQAMVRSWMAVKYVGQKREDKQRQEEYLASVKIQTCWRRFHSQKQYTSLVKDVLVCQCIVRRKIAVSHAKELRHERSEAAATSIQASWKRHITMSCYKRSVSAVTTVQALWRAHVTQGTYANTIFNLVLVQSLARRLISKRLAGVLKEQKRIAELAATKISSSWRAFACLIEYKYTVLDVTLCQSIVRRHRAITRAQQLRQKKRVDSATKIQCRWRAHFITYAYIQTYLDIVTIQSLTRRRMSMRLAREMKEEKRCIEYAAANKISSSWRMFVAYRTFKRAVQDVTCCQSVFRRNVARSQAKAMIHEKRMHSSTLIQARWRAYFAVDEYTRTVFQVIQVQSITRRLLASRLAGELRTEAVAATKISSSWRRFISRIEFMQTVQDVIVCQSVGRRNVAMAQANMLRHGNLNDSATTIQSKWRSHCATRIYVLALAGIVRVQTFIRKQLAREVLCEMKRNSDAATAISACWRRFSVSKQYERFISDVIICQSVHRRNTANKQAARLFRKKHQETCASYIQETWKAHAARTRFALVVSKMKDPKFLEAECATDIAKSWRAIIARRKYKSVVEDVKLCQSVVRRHLAVNYVKSFRARLCNSSATVIQTKWRNWIISRNFRRLKSAVVELQCRARKGRALKLLLKMKLAQRMKERKLLELKSATRVEAVWRRFYCQRQYTCMIKDKRLKVDSASKIQAAWIGYIERTRYKITTFSIVVIQSHTRRMAAQRRFDKELEERRITGAATSLQKSWRCYKQQSMFKLCLSHCVLLQSLARRIVARRYCRERFLRESNAATCIQAKKSKYKNTVSKIISIQRLARRQVAQRHIRQFSEDKRLVESVAIIRIQSALRGHLERSKFRLLSNTVLVQSLVRGLAGQRLCKQVREERHLRESNAVQKLQASWRYHADKVWFRLSLSNIIVIQSLIRKRNAQRQVQQMKEEKFLMESNAAIDMQAFWRGQVEEIKYKRTVYSIVLIQNLVRKLIAQRHFRHVQQETALKQSIAATCIQAGWRGIVEKIKFKLLVSDVVKIQTIARGMAAQKCLDYLREERFVVEKDAALKVTASVRRFIFCNKLRCAKRSVVICHLREVAAADKISSTWRTFVSVRDCKHSFSGDLFCQPVPCSNLAAKVMLIKLQNRREACAQLIQKRWKAHAVKKLVVKMMSNMEILKQNETMAATRISNCWRLLCCQTEYKQTKTAITICQSIFRRWSALQVLENLRREKLIACAVHVQARRRTVLAYRAFLTARTSATTIQCLARQTVASRELNRLKEEHHLVTIASATTVITSWWRMYWSRVAFQRSVRVTKIAALWRAHQCRNQFQRTAKAVMVIQSFIRNWSSSRALKSVQCKESIAFAVQTQAKLRSKATVIQCLFRQNVATMRLKRLQEARKLSTAASATKVAASWRRYQGRNEFQKAVKAIRICQRAIRGWSAWHVMESFSQEQSISSVRIQTKWRSFNATQHFARIRLNAIIIQCFLRQSIAALELNTLKEANNLLASASATMIASHWRRYQCRNEFQCLVERSISTRHLNGLIEAHHDTVEAATKIAARWRMYQCRKEFLSVVKAITVCQSIIRSWSVLRFVASLRQEKVSTSALRIQMKWKVVLASQHFISMKMSAMIIQCLFRRKFASRYLNELKEAHHLSILVAAATMIATVWRKYHARDEYERTVRDVVTCQSIARRSVAVREAKSLRHERQCVTAVKIQAKWRGYLAVKRSVNCLASVIVLQAVTRQWIVARQVKLAKQKDLRERAGATKIRSCWLAFKCRREYVSTVLDVILCQSIIRRFLTLHHLKVGNEAGVESSNSPTEIFNASKSPPPNAALLRTITAIHNYSNGQTNQSHHHKHRSNVRKTFATRIAKRIILCYLRIQEAASTKIQTTYRRHICRKKWLCTCLTLRKVIVCQSIFRRWKAIRQTKELRYIKKQGPADIFEFIRTRQAATNKIQQMYQEHVMRSFLIAYQSYLARLAERRTAEGHCIDPTEGPVKKVMFSDPIVRATESPVLKNLNGERHVSMKSTASAPPSSIPAPNALLGSSMNNEHIIVKKVSFSEPAATVNEYIQPQELGVEGLDSAMDPAMHEIEECNENLDNDIYDLLLEEEIEEQVSIPNDADVDSAGLMLGTTFAEAERTVADEDDIKLESHCFDHSRCGLSDSIHEILMNSGKWFYDKLGDPSDETAEDLVTVMEMGEEFAFCCLKKKNVSKSNEPKVTSAHREEKDAPLSAIAIQSKWRCYAASKQYNSIRHGRALQNLRSLEPANSYEVGLSEFECQQQLKPIHVPKVESYIVKCQSVVRRFLAFKLAHKLTSGGTPSNTDLYSRPVRKHVAKTGQIETLLNDLRDDATLTDYSETDSGNRNMSDIDEALIRDQLNDLGKTFADALQVSTMQKLTYESLPENHAKYPSCEKVFVHNRTSNLTRNESGNIVGELEIVINSEGSEDTSLTECSHETESLCDFIGDIDDMEGGENNESKVVSLVPPDLVES